MTIDDAWLEAAHRRVGERITDRRGIEPANLETIPSCSGASAAPTAEQYVVIRAWLLAHQPVRVSMADELRARGWTDLLQELRVRGVLRPTAQDNDEGDQ